MTFINKRNLFITIIVLRIVSAFFILVYPLWGFLFYLFVDYWDAHIFINVAGKSWGHYQQMDKNLDIIGYIAMVTVGFRYQTGLFLILSLVFRLTGQLIFHIRKNQKVLMFFPNLIEVFYLWLIIIPGRSLMLLSVVIIAKLLQEYFLHYYWPDYLKVNGYPALIRFFGVKNKINWN